MAARWVSSPEPVASQVLNLKGELQYQIRDFARTATESRGDVYPGEDELLDVAVRFDGEPECYGWNNDSYFYRWRTPDWKLSRERYLVKVIVTSSGQQCVGVFRLVNDLDNRTDFRLVPASPDDWAKIS